MARKMKTMDGNPVSYTHLASSGRIEDGTEEQYAKLKQLDYIKQVGKSIFVGEATDVSENNEKTICDVVWADSRCV